MNNATALKKPDASEFAPYFKQYIDLVDDGDIREILANQIRVLVNHFESVSDGTAEQIHPPYTWTIRQVVGHMIDTEKIFGCRAHRIACCEDVPLPGFDQDEFVRNSDYSDVSINELVKELEYVRLSNLMLLRRLPSEAWSRSGICDGKGISVRAIAFLLAGHVNHHFDIIKKRLA